MAFGIPYNDHGFRMYSPQLGRWLTQDPLQQFASPYVFCHNNPLKFVDPNGLWDKIPGGYTTTDYNDISLFQMFILAAEAENRTLTFHELTSFIWQYENSNGGFYDPIYGNYYSTIPAIMLGTTTNQGIVWNWTNREEIVNHLNKFRYTDVLSTLNNGLGNLGDALGWIDNNNGGAPVNRTTSLGRLGGTISNIASILGLGLIVYDVIDGYKMDGNTFGYNAQRAVITGVGGIAGATCGSIVCAVAVIPTGPIGIVAAAIGGGMVGGYLGGVIMGEAWDYLTEDKE